MTEIRCPICNGQKKIAKMGLMGFTDCNRCNKDGMVARNEAPPKIELKKEITSEPVVVDHPSDAKEEPPPLEEPKEKEIEESTKKKTRARKPFLKRK